MHVGDRYAFTVGSSTVDVVIRDVRDDEFVLVQNELSGVGACSFLVRSELLTPVDVRPSDVLTPLVPEGVAA